jgi:hypothetical protein
MPHLAARLRSAAVDEWDPEAGMDEAEHVEPIHQDASQETEVQAVVGTLREVSVQAEAIAGLIKVCMQRCALTTVQ